MILKAYAKLNLTLDIVGRREDGYHFIDSVMQSVSLYDKISVKKADTVSLNCSVSALSGDDNIAYSAAKLFFEKTGITGGAQIYIEKNIPYPAGLGGGSSDAAAVLSALNIIYNAGLSSDRLREIGLCLGADIPFCIDGGTARVGGIGENIEPLKISEKCGFVILNAGKKESAAAMYAAIDKEKNMNATTPAFLSALGSGTEFDFCGNAFSYAYADSPVWGSLRDAGARAVCLSGSGPSVFGVFYSENDALAAAERLRLRGLRALAAAAVNKGCDVLSDE